MSLYSARFEYTRGSLDERSINFDPHVQFEAWFADAKASDIVEPNAMVLATCGPDGRPSARVVLLRAFDERGLLFFTSYGSRKGTELGANSQAAVVFYWDCLERQVRIEGWVEKVPVEETAAYFASRPRASQIAALVSKQSQVLESRDVLESELLETEKRLADEEIPLPENWGGYRLVPDAYEFWQGRRSRLHDRIVYIKEPGDTWGIRRLYP